MRTDQENKELKLPFNRSRGIHLERKKDPSLLNTLKRPFTLKRARVPLIDGENGRLTVCVKPGDRVQVGQKLAHPKQPDEIPVYSGIAGRVEKIAEALLPDGRRCPAVDITADSEVKPPAAFDPSRDAETLSAEDLVRIFRELGLRSTDSGMEPVHSRIRRNAPVRTVVINACEPEPYVTSEQVLITSHLPEVLKGADILRKASGAEKVVFLVEEANREEYELIRSKIYLLKWTFCAVQMVPAIYPAGSEAFLRREFSREAMIWNASTAFAVYEAVFLGKPFFEKIVTVGGECVAEPRNLWLPVGFLFQDAVQACKGFLREPKKVLMGGPMTGIAQAGLDVPVLAGTSAVLGLPPEVAREADEQPCIRCNRCVDTCPVLISPAMITLAAEHGEFETAAEYGAGECIECGVCGYVCPSERPMADLIRLARQKTGGRK
jgi:electron transport complex protein RnfC